MATTLAGFAVAGFVTRAWIGALFAGVVLVSAGMVFVGVVREQDAYLLAGMTCFVLAALAAPVVHLLARLAARTG